MLVAGLVTYLRWWTPVTVDHRPVQRWVVVAPVLMVLCLVAVTNYGNLAAKGAAFTVLLLVSALLVGAGEELTFRGVGVTVFRSAGFTESKVAVWVTVAFGLAHATNLVTEGPAAFAQVLSTIVAGYFFSLIILAVVVVVRRHHIEPATAPAMA